MDSVMLNLKFRADQDTAFFLAPVTNGKTAAAIGVRVDDGLMDWIILVHDIVLNLCRPSLLSD